MSNRTWNEDDVKELKDMISRDMEISEICEQLDRSRLSIVNQINKLDKERLIGLDNISTFSSTDSPFKIESPKDRRKTIEKSAIDFLDMKIQDKDFNHMWSSILNFQEALDEKSIEQNEVNIYLKTNKWIGIAFQGDLHLGNMATNYRALLAHRDLMAKAKNLYVALNGDYCDNYIPSSHVSGMFEALFPPAIQKNLAKDYVEKLKDKILALVSGCHDLWGMKAADFDLTEYLAKHGEAAYLGNGGLINLTVGKTKYRIMMRHKYKFNSADNPTFTVKKMFEKLGGFDVGVVSHNHVACIEESVKEGLDGTLKRLFIRAGTYKTHDRFGRQMGFSEGDISVPIVLFNPDTRDMRGFQDLKEGIDYLEYLNKGR